MCRDCGALNRAERILLTRTAYDSERSRQRFDAAVAAMQGLLAGRHPAKDKRDPY